MELAGGRVPTGEGGWSSAREGGRHDRDAFLVVVDPRRSAVEEEEDSAKGSKHIDPPRTTMKDG